MPGPSPTIAQPQHLCLDKGNDYDGPRQIAYDYGLTAHIRRRGKDRSATPAQPGKPRRWVVGRAHSWLNRYRRILVRWEKLALIYKVMLHIVCAATVWELVSLMEYIPI
ncbi:transposase [Azospirillum sp. Marseille-Q6669]